MDSRITHFFNYIKGKRIALCGIGESNLPLARMFLEKGARIILCDKRDPESFKDKSELLNKLKENGAMLKFGDDYLKNLDVDIIFRTPGMSFYKEELTKARDNGIIVTSEMEVFFDLCPCKTIAITGSDGKTTTTTIISEMLKAAGKTVHLGGNIGRPLLPIIEDINEDDFAVIELSSFQLISMRKSPDIAVVTNLAPNHLDIHKDMTEYIDSKKNIILHQNAFSKAVLNLDNETTHSFADFVRGEVLYFSRRHECDNGAFLSEDGKIYFAKNGRTREVLNSSEIKIPGKHNAENYLAAICAVRDYVSDEDIKKVAHEFAGVEHRSEFVREINGIKFYNDSIASSPTRTSSGTLSLFDQKIIIIAGGYDKKIPFDELGKVIVDKVKVLVLLGATSDKIEKAVKDAPGYSINNPIIIRTSSMEEAVSKAYKSAKCGDIISLSPACASFDLYQNFDKRGKHYKEIVNNL